VQAENQNYALALNSEDNDALLVLMTIAGSGARSRSTSISGARSSTNGAAKTSATGAARPSANGAAAGGQPGARPSGTGSAAAAAAEEVLKPISDQQLEVLMREQVCCFTPG
jgi:hypothetical protein